MLEKVAMRGLGLRTSAPILVRLIGDHMYPCPATQVTIDNEIKAATPFIVDSSCGTMCRNE